MQSGYHWLQNLYQRTHILLTFASMQQGKQYVKTLMKILEFAKVRPLKNLVQWRNFVSWLSELDTISNDSQVEENAISIFSIHRSKGLEFPVVILADMTANIRELPSVIRDKATNATAVRLQKGLLETNNYQNFAEKEKNRLVAEEKRLLYVAATRARDYLMLPISGKKQGFLSFLDEDICNAQSNIHVDTFHSIAKSITLTSMEPIKIKNIDLVPESKWFADRQRFLSRQVKRHKADDYLIDIQDLSHAKREVKDLLFMRSNHSGSMLSLSEVEKINLIKNFNVEKILSCLQNLDERIQLGRKKYFNLPFAFYFEKYLVKGNIDIAFQENNGFVMMDIRLKQAHPRDYYSYLGTIYAFAVSQLLNCMLKEVSFYFVEEGEHLQILQFDFSNMHDIVSQVAKDYH